MINLGFWPVFGRFSAPRGPRRAPGAPGAAPARNIVQVAPKISPRDQLQGPFVGTLFLVPAAKNKNINDKSEAPQGQPMSDWQ